MQRVLSPAQEQLLRQERALLDDLRVQLARLEASDEDLELLKQSAHQLDELFLLVVVGEFNAGKTAFLNAMLGSRLLPEGVTPTTAHIHVLRYGDSYHHVQDDADLVTVFLPVEWLQEVNLVDTPGTNAVIQRHQQITEHFIPRSDLVLFVTSADRPFSESERTFLERIRQWGKKVVIVVNKMDMIESGGDRREILDFVRANARALLGAEPTIFPVSARLALQAKEAAGSKLDGQNGPPVPALWEASMFAPLEQYVLDTLDASERLRLKLENPLGVAARLTEKYSAVAQGRQQVLKGDFETLDLIDGQLAAYETDMRRDFKYQASRVDNVLYEMAERGDKFFDETLRIGRVFDLVNGQKISQEFDRQVVGDTSRAVERHVHDTIDWLVDKEYRQWRDIVDFLNRRWSQHADRIVGQLGRDFENSRQALLASIGRETQHIVDSYDRAAEADKLGEEVRRSIVQTAAIEAGAVGLGALLVAVLHTTLLDVTGILSAGALAALGFYLLPYRRQQLKAQLRERITELRAKLHDVLQKEFDEEMTGSLQRIREAMAPYTRFVRVERDKLSRIQADLGAAKTTVESLQAQVRRLGE